MIQKIGHGSNPSKKFQAYIQKYIHAYIRGRCFRHAEDI